MTAGDVVYVKAGLYNESMSLINLKGNATHTITLSSYQGNVLISLFKDNSYSCVSVPVYVFVLIMIVDELILFIC